MQTVSKTELIPFPNVEPQENFTFDCAADAGIFTFHFKWLNDRWNLWVTLPDESVRQAGTEPGVVSWSEFHDYGLVFKTDAKTIGFKELFQTEMHLITWL